MERPVLAVAFSVLATKAGIGYNDGVLLRH